MTIRNVVRRLCGVMLCAVSAALAPTPSYADVHVGVVVSMTGPGASIGQAEQNAIKLWPTEMAGQKVVVTVLNDDSDPATAAKNISKLVNEYKVDVVVGSSLTPTSLAMLQGAAESHTAMISLAGGGAIVEPMDDKHRWAFRLGTPEKFSANLAADDVKRHGGSTVGVLALASAFGEGYVKAIQAASATKGLRIVGVERFNLNDQSVTAQVAKLMALHPDAIYVAAAGTAGALPQIELVNRGFKGRIYQTSGVANADFLRVAGKSSEGLYVTVLPLLVAEQLKDGDPLKAPSMSFIRAYEGRYGVGARSGFAASAFDAYRIIESAVRQASAKGQPGTEAYRIALRDGIEHTSNLGTTTLMFNFSEQDHTGLDQRSQVLARVKDGKWILAE